MALPDLYLLVTRANEFPAGIKTAQDRPESKLPSLKGRKFYGLTFCKGSQLAYFAGVAPVSDEDMSSPGLPTMTIEGSKYARAKLFDQPNHIKEIGGIYDELIRDSPMAPNSPSVEHYRSQSDLHLLIPLVEPTSEDGKSHPSQ